MKKLCCECPARNAELIIRTAALPVYASFLRTVSMTWPFRAALVISSNTCLWDFPLTGKPSMQSSSSPARSRPSFSAAPSGTIAPMYTWRGKNYLSRRRHSDWLMWGIKLESKDCKFLLRLLNTLYPVFNFSLSHIIESPLCGINMHMVICVIGQRNSLVGPVPLHLGLWSQNPTPGFF